MGSKFIIVDDGNNNIIAVEEENDFLQSDLIVDGFCEYDISGGNTVGVEEEFIVYKKYAVIKASVKMEVTKSNKNNEYPT